MVGYKAHRLSIRISRVYAWGTSKLAYDGSSTVERGIDGNYSICKFKNGKIYNCDLSASYSIGARYFVREHLKSLPETARLDIQAKVTECAKRTTYTFSSTGDKILAEASPYDTIWGIGLEASHPDVTCPEKWKGKNLLGKNLMQVRTELRENNMERK